MTNADDVGRDIYRAAGASPLAVPDGGTADLAAAIYGDAIIRFQPGAILEGTLATIAGRRTIVVRKGLSPASLNFAIGKQLARLFVGGADDGDATRAVAAWLVAPPDAFRAQMQAGLWVGALADAFTMSATSAAIRIPEVGGPDATIVTPLRVHRRGKFLSWMSDDDVRALAAKPGVRSLRREVVRSNPQCVALFARAA